MFKLQYFDSHLAAVLLSISFVLNLVTVKVTKNNCISYSKALGIILSYHLTIIETAHGVGIPPTQTRILPSGSPGIRRVFDLLE